MLNDHQGFTVVEVLVALVILSFGVLGIATASANLAYRAAGVEQRAVALQAIEDRLAHVKAHPTYVDLDSVFTATGDSVSGAPGLYRTTDVRRTQTADQDGRVTDYTTITVSVFGQTLGDTLRTSIVVGLP